MRETGKEKVLKILITNDDGIMADGLIRLAKAAAVHGEVWVVAPDRQRSAASHSITLHTHIDLHPYELPVEGVHAFACSGTPCDCIRVGSLNVVPGRPDVVLSGINFGYNAASDIQYSATAGAAFEAVFQGRPAIAFSEGADGCHEVTDAYLKDILAELLKEPVRPGQIWNVNFPDCPLSDCRGVLRDRAVSPSAFYYDSYSEQEKLEGGGMRLMVVGARNDQAEEGSDMRAIMDNYVSVGLVNNIGWPILAEKR